LNISRRSFSNLFKRSFSETEVKRESILTNVTWLAVGNVAIKPIWFLFLMLTARFLGAAEYGQFMLAISFVSITYIFLEGGVDILTVRELSDNPSEFENFFGHTSFFKFASSAISSIIALLAAFILRVNWILVDLIILSCVYNVSNVMLSHFRMVFRAFEVLKYEAISAVIEKSAVIVFCAAILFLHLGVVVYSIGFALAYVVSCSITFGIVTSKVGMPKLNLQLSYLWRRIIKPALPFALMNIFIVIYFRSGTLMLGAITRNETWVGYYSAGYRLVESFTLFPTIIVAPIYASVTRQRDDIQEVQRIMLAAFRALLFIGVVISGSIFIFRERITLLFFGNDYRNAITTVGILALTMIPMSVEYGAGTLVAALNRQGKANWFFLFATIMNLLLNYFLINALGTDGAAITTTITETFLALSNLFIVRDYVPWSKIIVLFSKAITPMLLVGVLMLTRLREVSFVLQLCIASILVMGGYFLSKFVTLSDFRKLLRFNV
jgi:O-antigen/teichoic acid export membrane protein